MLRAWKLGSWRIGSWQDPAWLGTTSTEITTGTYQLTGFPVNLNRAYEIEPTTGSYSLTGNDVNLARNYILQPESGIYSLDGNSLILTFTTIPPTVENPHLKISVSKMKIGW